MSNLFGNTAEAVAVTPPPKKPVPPLKVPTQPSSVKPAPQVQDPPNPVLQRAGFNWGGIQTFNQRIQAVAQAHQSAHGTLPPAGLALDVVRSKVDPSDYTNLFNPAYGDPRASSALGAVNQHKQANPSDYFVTRPDGVQQPNTALYRMAAATVAAHPEAPESLPHFLKQYPMVEMGALPIPSSKDVSTAIDILNQPAPHTQALPGTPAAEASQFAIQARQEQLHNDAHLVGTLRQAQTELNTAMGTTLPVTGIFNQTWTDALSNWMKTADYAKQELTYQAQQEGFGNNVAAYTKAWHQKQKATSKGLTGWFMAAMPLALFGHGSGWDNLVSIPEYLKGPSNNPLNIGLHGLTRTAGLTMDTIGGTVSQAKADLAAGTTLVAEVNGYGTKRLTYDQALQNAKKQIHANPTWMRALGFGRVPVNETGWLLKFDQATNVLGDLVLLRKPGFTGEDVVAGDVAKAAKSTYLNTSAKWAYNDMAAYGKDGIGRASARLESGQGARELVARSAAQIKSGDMTLEQFQQHVAELYANGSTTVKVGDKAATVSGPLLDSLRTNKLPTPNRGWLATKNKLRNWVDDYDASTSPLAPEKAQAFVGSLRSAVGHYVPSRVGYMDNILPERVFNFVVKNKLGDNTAALANQLESQLVRFQGTENIRGIQAVQRKLEKLYFDKYPAGAQPSDEPFQAVLSTEAPSVFKFPKGGEPEVDKGFSAIEANARKVNATLNKIAMLHARVILSGVNLFSGLGGFSLFWKHLVGDTLRVEIGGGGVITGLDGEVRAAKAEIDEVANSDPRLSRMVGAFRERAVKGEANWVLNRGGNALTRSFTTGEKFNQGNYMAAAGGYLRRMVDDPAFQAYQSGDDALTQLVLHDKTYRGMWKAAKAKNPDMTAEEYGALIAERYKNVEGSLASKNLTLTDLRDFYNSERGAHADKELGKWIKDNKVDFDVSHGQVEHVGTFDHVTGWWVGNVIMKPNKLNRGRFAENVLARTYADLRNAGWEKADALETSTSVAAALTKYHMLDFANRLQIEQDLRWVSYFATKHRLYFKWVMGTFLRHPVYAAAVFDFQKTLNGQGGWTLPFKVGGTKWQVPLERLVWVPGREYDETSPLALAVFNFIKSGGNLDQVVQGAVGTDGNVITRSDTAVVLGTKLMKIEAGKAAATYGYAVQGLDSTTAGYVTSALNEYQITYQLEHGHYDSEQHAVKKVLLAQAGEEYWRANLPLPMVPEQDRTQEQDQLAQFMQLTDPRARSKFMADHPGFSDNFGVYSDPKTNLHNRTYFQRWTKAIDAYRSARTSLYAEAKQTGKWTSDMEVQRRALNASLNKTRNQLLIDDAQQAGINTRGLVPNGTTVPFGPWGKVVNKDPIFDVTHALNTLFPKLSGSVADDVIGPLQKQMQAELSELNDPKYVTASGYTVEEVKTRKVELLQKLQVFNSYPSDALGAVRDKYQTQYVNKYWAVYNTKYNAVNNLPSGERKAADASFRAWRDSQDEPVKVNGIQFPSPVRMAWATLDPVTRQERLSYLASKPLTDLADYELDLLGIKHPKNVSAAFSALDQALQTFREQHPGERADIPAAVKAINKQPGYEGLYSFYVNVLSEPRVRQFQATSVYQNMPSNVRDSFDQIASSAADVAKLIKAAKAAQDGTANQYASQWRQIVKTKIEPWIDLPANKQLKQYLVPMGPNFLYTLISTPRVG